MLRATGAADVEAVRGAVGGEVRAVEAVRGAVEAVRGAVRGAVRAVGAVEAAFNALLNPLDRDFFFVDTNSTLGTGSDILLILDDLIHLNTPMRPRWFIR